MVGRARDQTAHVICVRPEAATAAAQVSAGRQQGGVAKSKKRRTSVCITVEHLVGAKGRGGPGNARAIRTTPENADAYSAAILWELQVYNFRWSGLRAGVDVTSAA